MKQFVLIAVIVFVLFSSCAHNYYVAAPTNVPLLTHKGDANANINYFVGSRMIFIPVDAAPGFNLSGSYAFSDKIGIMGSGALMWENYDEPEEGNKYNLFNYEIGAGYINNWINKSFLFEIFAGAGYISQKHLYHEDEVEQNLKIRAVKYFIQPNIALKKKALSLTFSPKLVFVNHYDFHHDFESSGNEPAQGIDVFMDNPKVIFFEPALDLKLGSDLVKFALQFKYIKAFGDKVLPYPRFMTSIGVQVGLDELIKGKSSNVQQDLR